MENNNTFFVVDGEKSVVLTETETELSLLVSRWMHTIEAASWLPYCTDSKNEVC